jgi:hypothetical protein
VSQHLHTHLICLSLLLCVAPLGSCQSSGAEQQKDDQSVVGSPPSEEDDPFRIIQTPEDAEEAPSKGTIGEDEDSGDQAATKPAEPQEPPPEPAEPDEHQCFSCVRLCPTTDEGNLVDGECAASGEDVICGWGVHPKRDAARKMARAECNGALDLTRKMPTWSMIEGKCPAARCR